MERLAAETYATPVRSSRLDMEERALRDEQIKEGCSRPLVFDNAYPSSPAPASGWPPLKRCVEVAVTRHGGEYFTK